MTKNPVPPYSMALCSICEEYTFEKDLGTRYRKTRALEEVVIGCAEYVEGMPERMRIHQALTTLTPEALAKELADPMRWCYSKDSRACSPCQKPVVDQK